MVPTILMLAAQVAQPVAQSVPARPALICREAQQLTGTRIRTARRCKSAEEWQREDEEHGRIPLSAQVTEGQSDLPARPPR